MLEELKSGVTIFLDWTYGGVNFTGPGNNGGLHCRDHVTDEHRIFETFVGIGVAVLSFALGYVFKSKGSFSGNNNNNNNNNNNQVRTPCRPVYNLSRIFLLVIHTFVFGLEVGFKFASRQLIFLLNPCHVTTCIQIYLLAVPAGFHRYNNSVYQLMLHFLHGPMTAILFPVTECLHLPFEVSTYWIQHVLLMLVPLYMLLCSDEPDQINYTPHRPLDFSWIFTAFGVWSFWHWVVLQGVGYVTLVNAGSMLCSAPSDPFDKEKYRLIGIIHQFLAIVVFGTAAGIIGKLRNYWQDSTKLKSN